MRHATSGALLVVLLAAVARPGAADTSGAGLSTVAAEAGRDWKSRLGLSPDQAARFLPALKADDADLKALREQLRSVVRKLRTQIPEKAPEEDVQGTLREIARVRKAIAARNERFDGLLATFLSPSQRAKLLVWKSLDEERGAAGQEAEAGGLRETPVAAEAEDEPE